MAVQLNIEWSTSTSTKSTDDVVTGMNQTDRMNTALSTSTTTSRTTTTTKTILTAYHTFGKRKQTSVNINLHTNIAWKLVIKKKMKFAFKE